MKNTILTDGTVVYYAIKVNGQLVSRAVSERAILEAQINTLPPNERAIAEIVTVTASNQEILLG